MSRFFSMMIEHTVIQSSMGKKITLSDHDLKTIHNALRYAIDERADFASCVANSPSDREAFDRAVEMVRDFKAMHERLFGPEEKRSPPKTISLFDLAAKYRGPQYD